MMIMKLWAVVFALLVLVKMVMLVVARDYYLGLVGQDGRAGEPGGMIYGVAAAVVGIPVLLQVDIIVIGAVMLWTSLLVTLGMAPYGEILLKWRDEIAREGLSRVWWVMALWTGLAVWILAAVFRG